MNKRDLDSSLKRIYVKIDNSKTKEEREFWNKMLEERKLCYRKANIKLPK